MAKDGVLVKKNQAHYLDVKLKDSSTYLDETGVPIGSVSFQYWTGTGAGTFSAPSAPPSWLEKGHGWYRVFLPSSYFSDVGEFHFRVTGTGFVAHEDWVNVGHHDYYQGGLQTILDSDHSEPFSHAWVLKMVLSRLMGNFAEMSRTIGADGLTSATFRAYEFTGTSNAEAGGGGEKLADVKVQVSYSGGARTLLSTYIKDPVYDLG